MDFITALASMAGGYQQGRDQREERELRRLQKQAYLNDQAFRKEQQAQQRLQWQREAIMDPQNKELAMMENELAKMKMEAEMYDQPTAGGLMRPMIQQQMGLALNPTGGGVVPPRAQFPVDLMADQVEAALPQAAGPKMRRFIPRSMDEKIQQKNEDRRMRWNLERERQMREQMRQDAISERADLDRESREKMNRQRIEGKSQKSGKSASSSLDPKKIATWDPRVRSAYDQRLQSALIEASKKFPQNNYIQNEYANREALIAAQGVHDRLFADPQQGAQDLQKSIAGLQDMAKSVDARRKAIEAKVKARAGAK